METSFLESLIFPWVLFSRDGIAAQGQGSIFRLENSVEPDIVRMQDMKPGAWVLCRNGYAAYAFEIKRINEHIVVLHGLKINGLSTIRGRSALLSIRTEREHIEQYVGNFKTALNTLEESYKSLIRENIHEIRGINSSLYNAAYELQQRLESYERGDILPIAKNVVGLSQILTGRIDYMDFIANPTTESVKKSEIPVYKKFDKVQKCFRVTAAAKRVSINFSGSGTKTVYGPPIFDLIPYLLIENAVKYAPEGSSVEIICTEGPQTIRCEVRSIGPKVLDDEVADIFTAGVRGQIAQRTGRSGTGLGLSVLRRLVETVFSGSITFSQSSERVGPHNLPYCSTSFEVVFRVQWSSSVDPRA